MNNRIDLTQFERMIGGPWRIEWLDGADTDNEEPSAAINAEDYGTIAQTFYRDWDKPYEATTKAIAAVPELIAELKRCYEEFDNLKRLVTWNHTDSDKIANDDDLLVVLTWLLTSE